MALWNGTTLNTNSLASAINKWHQDTFVPMVVKNNGLLYAMKSKDGAPTTPQVGNRFRKEKMVSGLALNVRLLGSLPTPVGLADSAQGTAIGNFTFSDTETRLGAATFQWSHFVHTEPIYMSDMKLIRGDEAKTVSFMQDKVMMVQKGWEAILGNGIMSSSAPTRSVIGGLLEGVDSGNTYGTIDRTDSANADYRSYVTTAPGGTLTLNEVDDCQLEIIKAGGVADIAVMGKTPYKKMLQELRGYSLARPAGWDGFTGQMIGEFQGVKYIYDHRGDDTTLAIGDSSALCLYQDEDGITDGRLISARAVYPGMSHVLPFNSWLQFVVIAPSWWARINSITN